MELKERLKKIVELEGAERGAQAKFLRKIGLGREQSGLLGDWLNGKSAPGAEYRRLICLAYDINREWFDTGNGDMLVKTSQAAPEANGGGSPGQLGIIGHHAPASNLGPYTGPTVPLSEYRECIRNLTLAEEKIKHLKAELESKQSPPHGQGEAGTGSH
ncbi:MAG: hypothetical protein WC657_08430 [Candidatus Paceibacterota bacterium]|jgi:hypothetical protein